LAFFRRHREFSGHCRVRVRPQGFPPPPRRRAGWKRPCRPSGSLFGLQGPPAAPPPSPPPSEGRLAGLAGVLHCCSPMGPPAADFSAKARQDRPPAPVRFFPSFEGLSGAFQSPAGPSTAFRAPLGPTAPPPEARPGTGPPRPPNGPFQSGPVPGGTLPGPPTARALNFGGDFAEGRARR
jgi:hypothetical protein